MEWAAAGVAILIAHGPYIAEIIMDAIYNDMPAHMQEEIDNRAEGSDTQWRIHNEVQDAIEHPEWIAPEVEELIREPTLPPEPIYAEPPATTTVGPKTSTMWENYPATRWSSKRKWRPNWRAIRYAQKLSRQMPRPPEEVNLGRGAWLGADKSGWNWHPPQIIGDPPEPWNWWEADRYHGNRRRARMNSASRISYSMSKPYYRGRIKHWISKPRPYRRKVWRRRRGKVRYRKAIRGLPKQPLGGLTRGTGQVNAIYHTSDEGTIAATAGTSYVDFVKIRLPGASDNRKALNLVIAFEILSVTFYFESPKVYSDTGITNSLKLSLMTKEPLTTLETYLDDPSIIAQYSYRCPTIRSVAPYMCTPLTKQYTYDLTDDCGHGFIVVSNDLWLRAITDDWGYSGVEDIKYYCKIQYRYKNVGKGDYIGTRFVQRK